MSDQENNEHNENKYSPIQCQLYDYIEIACMRHYTLNLELKSGDVITGKALTTRINNKQEFIVIDSSAVLNSGLGLESGSGSKAELVAETLLEKTARLTKIDGIETEKNNENSEIKIRLDLIKTITALDKNAEFTTVAIN